MDPLIKAIDEYPNGTELIILWNNGLKIKGEIDTIYEANNGRKTEDKEYEEYYACAFLVKEIMHNVGSSNIQIGSLIEISREDIPKAIFLPNGAVIWEI